MDTKILRGLLGCAMALAAFPALAQTVRFIGEGPAFAYYEDQMITERIVDQVIGAPVGEGAQVVFFRAVGAGSGQVRLAEGDRFLAELPAGAYYAIAVAPGPHTYSVDGRPLPLDVRAGTRSFVRIGIPGQEQHAVPSHALTFLRLSTNLRPPLLK